MTTTRRRSLRLGTVSLLLALPALALPSLAAAPAQAATTTLDCSTGPVTISGTAADYVLVGSCQQVRVTGVYAKVQLVDASEVRIDAPGVELTSTGTIRSLRLSKLGGGAEVVASRIRSLRSSGATLSLTAAKVGTLDVRGPYTDAKVVKARRALVRAPTSTLRFDRLARLDISGSTTTVVVRKGSTRVRDTGYRTTVRVHRRR